MLQIMVVTVFGTFLPLWWLTQSLGNTGLWLSFTAAFVIRALMGFWIFHRYNQQGVWFNAYKKGREAL
jgi:MATE family multidrug resistance protein